MPYLQGKPTVEQYDVDKNTGEVIVFASAGKIFKNKNLLKKNILIHFS